MSKKKKVRVALRKNRTKPPRGNDLTEQFKEDAGAVGDAWRPASGSARRATLSRHRTILQQLDADADIMPAAEAGTVPGRVVRVHGLYSFVELDDGTEVRCTVRRLLKSLTMDERSVVRAQSVGTGSVAYDAIIFIQGQTANDALAPVLLGQPGHCVCL